jgi:hypothetical protein
MRAHVLATALCAGLLFLTACGGGSPGGETALEPQPVSAAAISVLMMGNSHTLANQLPKQLEELLRAGSPGKTVSVVVAPGSMFLDERLADRPSIDLLRSRQWTAVVLQAQKYSSSGMYAYSTAEAQTLVRETRAVKALPVLFPEWARRGVPETETIYALHVSIARQQPACVAPVGQAWDLAHARMPTLGLHASDGNHSNAAGANLAALMLYATITGKSPSGLPAISNGVNATVQERLGLAAADTALAVAPRQHCPAE